MLTGAVVTVYLACFALLAYRRPALALVLLVASLPTYGVRFSLLGAPATLLEATIWVVAVVWFVTTWRQHGAPPFSLRGASDQANPFAPLAWPVMLWLVVASAAAVYSPNLEAALGIWKAYFVEPVLVFALLVVVLRGREERWWVLYALGATVVALGALAYYQRLIGDFLPPPWDTNLPRRVTSFYSYPNALGLFVAPVLAAYVTWFLQAMRQRPLSWALIVWQLLVVVLGAGAVVFSISRGAWVGVAVAAGGSAALVFREYWRGLLVAGAAVMLLVVSVPVWRATFVYHLAFQSPSAKVRLAVWEETLRLLADHPVGGAGLAGYQMALEPYHQWWRPEILPYRLEIYLYPHNVFLNFWTELGLAGLIVFLWLLAVFFRLVWSTRGGLSPLALAAMVALLVHGLVDAPYFKNDLAVLFWIIVALPLLEAPSLAALPEARRA